MEVEESQESVLVESEDSAESRAVSPAEYGMKIEEEKVALGLEGGLHDEQAEEPVVEFLEEEIGELTKGEGVSTDR